MNEVARRSAPFAVIAGVILLGWFLASSVGVSRPQSALLGTLDLSEAEPQSFNFDLASPHYFVGFMLVDGMAANVPNAAPLAQTDLSGAIHVRLRSGDTVIVDKVYAPDDWMPMSWWPNIEGLRSPPEHLDDLEAGDCTIELTVQAPSESTRQLEVHLLLIKP